MPSLFFEDLTPGWSVTCGPALVSKDHIVAFAREFDPQPFHIDEDAAKRSFVGTLIASGWHTCAIAMRLIADGFLLDSTGLGAPGIEEVRWLKPVLPGDELGCRITAIESRESRSRPDIGLVRFRMEVTNGRGETVMTQQNWIIFGRRAAPWPPAPGTGPSAAPGASPPPATRVEDLSVPSPYLEDLAIGESVELGAFAFTAGNIVAYAEKFDPQRFHLDEEEARRSLFGGLCASGWHTGAAWMRLMVDHRLRAAAEAKRRGERPARLGPSAGFSNLKWSRPVYAGDTISYRSTLTAARPSTGRPGWGIAFHRNEGTNQHGQTVFSFEGSVLWERRPAEGGVHRSQISEG